MGRLPFLCAVPVRMNACPAATPNCWHPEVAQAVSPAMASDSHPRYKLEEKAAQTRAWSAANSGQRFNRPW